MSGPAESSDSTRHRLVAVGVDLLDTDGLDGVGLRAIARRAGVSHGAPRRYFATHAELLAAIARTGIEDLADDLTPLLRVSASPRDRLIGAGRAYVWFARSRRAMFELMFRHDLLDGAGGDLRSLSVPLLVELRSVVAEIVDDERAWSATVQMWTSLHGVAVLVANRAMEPIEEVARIEPELLIERIVDGALRAGIDPVGGPGN